MLSSSKLAQLGLFGATLAMATPTTAPGKRCVDLKVPIAVDYTNYHYSMPEVNNNIDAVDWALNFTVWTQPTDRVPFPVLVQKTFDIHARLCVPSKKTDKAGIVQITVNGNGWDKRYWDAEVKPETYSYVDAAIKEGYSVLSFDRLGTGKSDHANAYDEVQADMEVEILASLTRHVRDGTLLKTAKILNKRSDDIVKDLRPSHIVHVGHSYGALLVAGMLHRYPDMSDAAILQSFLPINAQFMKVFVGAFEHDFAAQHDPRRFGDYGSGYIVLTSENTLQKLYLTKGGFEPEVLQYMEKIKQPEAVALYASGGQVALAQSSFKGPVQIVIGELDFVNCNGDCRGTYTLEDHKNNLFPMANLSIHALPNTAHALNMATSAREGYEAMFANLKAFGL